jgi:threonine synthase
MLRRKTIIVLVITLMVTAMVTAFSYLYVSQILRVRITNANDTASSLTRQLAYAVYNAVPDFGSTSIDTNNPAAVRRALTDYLQTDVALNNLLQSDPGDWRFIYDVTIVDINSKALLHTNAGLVGKVIAPRPEFQKVVGARFRQ